MAIAHDAPAAPEGKPRRRATDNPLVRSVGRIPLPLGPKLLAGFALIAALLAIGSALGLVALSQSNSRGKQLEKLQETEAFLQEVKADAHHLVAVVDRRLAYATGLYCGNAGACQNLPPGNTSLYRDLDAVVANNADQFLEDFGLPGEAAPPLNTSNPAVVKRVRAEWAAFESSYATVNVRDSAGQPFPTVCTRRFGRTRCRYPALERPAQIVSKINSDLSTVEARTSAKTLALVAADQTSFSSSRTLLLAVAGGSLGLAVVLGLLLSWSVAAAVNRMNDELGRLHDELAASSRHESDSRREESAD